MNLAYKLNSYLKDTAKIPLYSENNIPYAETEDDLASKSVPEENPLGIGRVSHFVESATAKRKDSIEAEFDIISDEEIEEIKEEIDRNSRRVPPAEIYDSNQYPGAGLHANHERNYNSQVMYNSYNQPAGLYTPLQPPQNIPQGNQPSTANWAFGKPLRKRIFKGSKQIMKTFW